MDSADRMGSGNVNWGALKSDLQEEVKDKIQEGGDVAKQILKNGSGPVIDTGCGIAQTRVSQVINQNVSMVCAPIVIQAVKSGAEAVTPYVKQAVRAGIEKSVDYSTQKSIELSQASIEKGFSCFGLEDNPAQNPPLVEEKLVNDETADDLAQSFEYDSEEEPPTEFKQIGF